MRKIKFRLRIGDKIVGYERIKPDEDGYLISTYSFDNSIGGWIFKPIKHKDKDQFIGSKDKNGKEIYEGDIIKSLSFNGILTINEIIYNKKEGAFTLKSGYLFARFKNEIIGNIYENPELKEKLWRKT